MELYQNGDMIYEIRITSDGEPLLSSDVEKVEFTFGKLSKVFPENEDITTEDNGIFKVRLRQEETVDFEKTISVQIRVKKLDGCVIPSVIKNVCVCCCLSKEVL